MTNLLLGKHAVITGGGRGIGRALALRLADSGAALTLVARSADELRDAARELAGRPVPVRVLTADLAELSEVERVAADIVEQGGADILINNAATVEPLGFVADLDSSEVGRALLLNVAAPLVLSSRLAPAMVERGWGRIVNISSGVAARPAGMIGGSAYATSKAALEAQTLNLAAELSASGVTVNAFRPGRVDTVMQQWVRSQKASRVGGLQEQFQRAYETGALISPHESAFVLLQRLQGHDTGAVWSIDDQF